MTGAATTTLGRVMERNVSEVFGERDPVRRKRAIAELYADECAVYDAEGESIGQAAVSDHVGRVLDQGAPGFAFRTVGAAEVIQDLGRLRWELGPAGAPAVVSGMDVAVFAGGRIRTLYTYIETPTAPVEANVEVVREYTRRVFNGHDPDLASEYVTPDVKWHGGTLGTVEGAENLVGLLQGFIGALPDLNAQEQDIAAQGDLVAVRFVVEATHQGDLLGIAPTGRRVRWDAVDVYRLKDGKITEEWAADDMAAILHQVGAYTPPWLS